MIAIINYGAGNLTSVKLALDALKAESVITSSPSDILSATHIVFPGVGAIGSAMQKLANLKIIPAIQEAINKGIPFLGICLGTQIILKESEEDGGVKGLGLIDGMVKRFIPQSHWDKIPQIGWNTVQFIREHCIFNDIENNSEFYFVHSYYPVPLLNDNVMAITEYAGTRFASIIASKNIIATQFHPEKSGRIGIKLIKNFLAWDGKSLC